MFEVSLNTCGGCHLSETGTGFTMVKAGGALNAPAALAGFLTGVTVNDAENGPPTTHHVDDLHRRGFRLYQIAANSCFVFPRFPLEQSVRLPERPRLPESVFSPRFVH
jgi:hypothetical protein